MLEIKNYNSSILHEISFFLKENENLIILGENGAGKSTLAKVLSNLILNDKVELLGENISKISDLKRTQLINYIPPKLSIFDEYVTLREFLELSFIENVNKYQNPFRRPIAMAVFLFGTFAAIWLGFGATMPIDKAITLGLF